VHRVARFSRYLLDHGWTPHVLTAHTRAYEQMRPGPENDLPPRIHVTRAFALDSQRHLAFRGRFLRISSLPDRWVSWILGAIPAGLYLIYKRRIDVILVTFPLATTVLIGLLLRWLTGKPLVVDFRDSMTEDEYPRDPLTRRFSVWIERNVIRLGSRFIFTTPSARAMYLKRYPNLRSEHCILIANGYDDDDFSGVSIPSAAADSADRALRLVHSGLIYPDDRDPRAFFKALQRLKNEGAVSSATLRIDLRASGSEEYYRVLLEQLNINDIVSLLPAIPYHEALQDTAKADGLLLFQAASCNHQIPAKVYEYLRLGKPILALTSPLGDTATLLEETGGATIADLADEQGIYVKLSSFLESLRQRKHAVPDSQRVEQYTRRNGTRQLANVLDTLLRQDSRQSGAVQNEATR
jgi:glycosyltransferase involved in cell wall biosynthesis